MHLAYTIVYVANVAESVAFLAAAFGLTCRFIVPTGDYAELETGSTALALAQHDTARANLGQDYRAADASSVPLGMEIGLSTDDVPMAYARALAAGATGLKPPATKPWGQTVAYVRCPDGLLVELCTPMG